VLATPQPKLSSAARSGPRLSGLPVGTGIGKESNSRANRWRAQLRENFRWSIFIRSSLDFPARAASLFGHDP